jgi:uncharacterized membrane protein YphA (DoxX/SURF4 family)
MTLKPHIQSLLSVLARAAIGSVLILSGLAKVEDPMPATNFLKSMGLPYIAISVIVSVVAYLEIVLALCLLFGYLLRYSLPFVVAMLALMLLIVLYAIGIGVEGDCGCFGSTWSTGIGLITLGRNICLLGVSVYLVTRRFHPLAIDNVLLRNEDSR